LEKTVAKRLSATPSAAKKSANRYQEIQAWIVKYLRKTYNDDDINLGSKLPNKLMDGGVMTQLIVQLYQKSKKRKWNLNQKSTISGEELAAVVKPPPPEKPKPLSYLVHYIYQRTT
jgi:hypothetical protein